jgi:hypothetical protein
MVDNCQAGSVIRLLVAVAVVIVAGGCSSSDTLPWEDDFSDPTTGWRAETDASAEVSYDEGKMLVHVKWADKLSWASAGRDIADFHLSVRATQASGPDDNEYGVLIRMQDSQQFYVFAISGDGYYRIAKRDGADEILLSGDWARSDAINEGAASNLLEVTCVGERMTMRVNEVLLATVEDDSYASGDIGLYAGTFRDPGTGVEIHFDDLRVAAP